jgi:hypothetical protein
MATSQGKRVIGMEADKALIDAMELARRKLGARSLASVMREAVLELLTWQGIKVDRAVEQPTPKALFELAGADQANGPPANKEQKTPEAIEAPQTETPILHAGKPHTRVPGKPIRKPTSRPATRKGNKKDKEEQGQ